MSPPAPPLSGPRRRRPAPRQMLITLALAVLLIAAAVPAVSAETIINETLSESKYTGGDYTYQKNLASPTGNWNVDVIRLKKAQDYTDLNYIGLTVTDFSGASNFLEEGTYETTYTYNGVTNPCNIYVEHDKNFLGQLLRYRFLIFPQNWNNGGLTGLQTITLGTPLYTQGMTPSNYATEDAYIASSNRLSVPIPGIYKLIISSSYTAINNLIVSMPTNYDYEVKLIRQVDGVPYSSRIDLKNGASILVYNEETSNFYHIINKNAIDTILVTLGSNTYQYDLNNLETDPGSIDINNSVTVYVQNSQTGALLADAHLSIQDTTTDPWTEVVNETLSSGQGSFSLPKDTGLHLTQYKVTATVPGYQQVVPALFARVTGPTNIVVEMEPTAGGPVNETNTYLKFYVRDSAGNGVGSANIVIGDVMRYTNSQGYAQFEVAKNSTHEYTISKFRYTQVSGTATVYDDDSYTVSITLLPGAVPTYTQPGEAPTPDSRSPAEKAASGLDYLLDNAENFGIMAGMILMIYMCYWMVPKR